MSQEPEQTHLRELAARLHASVETGQIWLDQQRMIMIHASSMGSLRKEMIETLGSDRARGLLTRMGYASGRSDARMARELMPNASDVDIFLMGPQLHMLEGITRVHPVKVDININRGILYGEFIWEGSFEGTVHREAFGLSTEPACWMQLGYACGYTNEMMKEFTVYREVECVAKGDPHCRIIGKPASEWDDVERDKKYFQPDRVADLLLELQGQVERLRYSVVEQMTAGDLVGHSPAFRATCELINKAAASQVTVLLLGETGVGKEMFARALHKLSSRANSPMVAVNCAAIPEDLIEAELFGVERGAFTGANQSRPGRFERAHGGTLFLDEVGDLSAPAQAKLLRVLQEGEFERIGDTATRRVDVRVVAATNVNLQEAVQRGEFRSDLFYRLNIFPVVVPPLRDRRDDIEPLVQRFIDKHAVRHGKRVRGVTDSAMRAMHGYPWPGNIRELENMIERGVIMAQNDGWIEPDHLFLGWTPGEAEAGSAGTAADPLQGFAEEALAHNLHLDDLEGSLLELAVRRAGGNLSSAARALGLTRPQLAYRMKKRGMSA
ncbi:MAG TPA: sigma 54-interacting transcriptional regulator [Gammaproteobacteria bacterium]